MRQRLGIANALLGDPKILMLDEPANGLDPAGIHWMRSLLREYANRGGTVLLSSHLLHEIEVIADEIIVIGHGKIVAQGTKAELLQTAGTFVKAVRHVGARQRADHRRHSTASPSGDGGLRTEAAPETVGKAAAAAGVALVELRPAEGAGLEEMFLELTGDTQRESTAHRRSHRMSTATVETIDTTKPGVPLGRLVKVELRKMFDTRSGFWLMMSIADRRPPRDDRRDHLRAGQQPRYGVVRHGDRRPDGDPAAGRRDLVGDGRVEPAHRADHLHAGPAPRAGHPGQGHRRGPRRRRRR